jgi:hypothetical protein
MTNPVRQTLLGEAARTHLGDFVTGEAGTASTGDEPSSSSGRSQSGSDFAGTSRNESNRFFSGFGQPLPTVADVFWRAQRTLDVTTHAEFVPGIGTIVSARVPVRCELVASESATSVETAPSATLPTDEEWEAAAEGREPAAGRGMAGEWLRNAAPAPQRTLRYDDAALAAVKRTVLDAAWRFGGKLELARGERLAVVVEVRPAVTPAQLLRDEYSRQDSLTPFGDERAYELLKSAAQAAGPAGTPIATPATKRLIVVMTAEDLKSFRAGDVEPQEQAAAASGDF